MLVETSYDHILVYDSKAEMCKKKNKNVFMMFFI